MIVACMESCRSLYRLLRTEGHAVKIAGGVVAATQFAAKQPFDLLRKRSTTRHVRGDGVRQATYPRNTEVARDAYLAGPHANPVYLPSLPTFPQRISSHRIRTE